MNGILKLKSVSQSNISSIRKRSFKNVEIKRVGCNFSKCSECDFLKEFIARTPRGTEEWQTLVEDLQTHLRYQSGCRKLYHSWRNEACVSPTEFLCIIHDKMDTKKTALPRMRVITKGTAGLGKLPMGVTGILTHGHGDGAYAHYGTSFWPGDSNFTISSLCKVLRALEIAPVCESKLLFPHPPVNEFFEALLWGKSACRSSIPPSTGDFVPQCTPPADTVPTVPLPKNLYLQLDNSAKDNKNRFLMAFCSLLTAKEIFKEVQVAFLVVGHTHEDIDAYFSYLSKKIKGQNIYTLTDLMKSFMDSQDNVAFIPEMIQEVCDFKAYLDGFQHEGKSKIVGLADMHLFRFYVDDQGWPVMRYKKRSTDQSWLPPGKPVRMWRQKEDGTPLVPIKVEPDPVRFRYLWGNEKVDERKRNKAKESARVEEVRQKRGFILDGISKFIDYWRSGMDRCFHYATGMQNVVRYWEGVSSLLVPEPEQPPTLIEGFWPKTNWKRDHTGRVNDLSCVGDQDISPEDEEEAYPYCGPADQRPGPQFNPYRDVLLNDWVYCQPADGDHLPIWMGRCLTCVVQNMESVDYGTFWVEWWTPIPAKKESKANLARHCWKRPWRRDVTPHVRIHCSSVIYSERQSKRKDGEVPDTHRIKEDSATAAIANLEAQIDYD